MSNRFYITTSIAYVNAKPHIGFAMEVIQADSLARYHRLLNDDVYFLTGTDEHGSKMAQVASAEGISPQALADRNAEVFASLKDSLNLSNDDFIRTTKPAHKAGAQKLWRKLVEAGDIYKSQYKGFYCVGCENFITEKDLVDEKCPTHLKKPEVISEDNYFFKLSKYSKLIGDKIRSCELIILPESRKKEILNVIDEGLKDVSFSRPKAVLTWGVEVPDDPDQVMYVWCDALSNYITALDYEHDGELFKKFWPANVHLIGKDIIRFHAAIWIGMLLSAEIDLPKAIYVHGFITSEGQKMSKSLGNVVDPLELVKNYGTDAVRYYLLKEIPTTDDGDFSLERFKIIYNADLANNLGNLLNRVVAMTEKYFEEKLEYSKLSEQDLSVDIQNIWKDYDVAIADFDLKRALEIIFMTVNAANLEIENEKPWVLAKNDQKRLKNVMARLLADLGQIALMLWPFLPETAEKIADSLGLKVGDLKRLEVVPPAKVEFRVKKAEVLFPRIEG